MTEIYRIETMLFAAHKLIKEGFTRPCGACKKVQGIPRNARFSTDPDMGGFYWECQCGSTLTALIQLQGFEKRKAA